MCVGLILVLDHLSYVNSKAVSLNLNFDILLLLVVLCCVDTDIVLIGALVPSFAPTADRLVCRVAINGVREVDVASLRQRRLIF